MRIARVVAMVALAFLCVTAIAGAVPLIIDPTGRLLQMPQSILEHSPFHTFLIPGLILLVANGILSIVTFLATWRRAPGYGWWVALQGCVLTGWISVEAIIMRTTVWDHFLYWSIALILIMAGLTLTHKISEPD
jgi:hypothetical protein